MQKTDTLYTAYVEVLKEELLPAMGCTEPIAIAYAAAAARRILNELPCEVCVTASGNIIKNVKSVFVPNTGGLRGIPAAAAAGIIAGHDELLLEVISKATEAEQAEIKAYMEHTPITVKLSDSPYIFDIDITVKSEHHTANVRIVGHHTNIVHTEKDGEILLDTCADTVKIRARAMAAAGSDARMNGCSLPVVIVSGSGNQGMTASLPVVEYAKELNVGYEKMIRAVALSDLVTIHLKSGIGRLSAYCGAVSAGCGCGAGIAYLYGGGLKEIEHTIVNSIAIDSGMVCDGAKASCAAKIASAVDAGILGYHMYKNGQQFRAGDGLVTKGVEETIRNIGILAREGMRETDREILHIMCD